MLPDYMPDEKTLKKRREPKFVIDPKDVVATDDIRVRQWADNKKKQIVENS